MKKYIDIHCHMLPGVDDGAKDLDMALKMLELSVSQGAQGIVFTPHYEMERNRYQPDDLEKQFLLVKQEAKKRWPELELYLGNELLLEIGAAEHMREAVVKTINQTKFLLVEFPFHVTYRELYDMLKQLQKQRFRPVLAHVERFSCLVGNMDRIMELTEMGIYLQMNANSMVGSFMDANVRWCRKLLKQQCITFLGTDAHNIKDRAPNMAEGIRWMEKHLDAHYLENITLHYPRRMLNNQYPEL